MGVEQQAVSANPHPFLCAHILRDKERSWVTFCPSPIPSFHTCKSRHPLANPGWQQQKKHNERHQVFSEL